MQSTSGSDHGQDVLQPVYRDLHFPTRAHRSAAVPQVFPGPCTAPQTHRPPTDHPPLTTHHTPPHRARTTFGFECHASCPSLSPWPACSTLSRPPTPTLTPCPAHEPCPCPRFLLLLPLLVPLPLSLPHEPFPSLCLPFWVSRPVPSCPLDPCLLSQECLSPVFPPTACT